MISTKQFVLILSDEKASTVNFGGGGEMKEEKTITSSVDIETLHPLLFRRIGDTTYGNPVFDN